MLLNAGKKLKEVYAASAVPDRFRTTVTRPISLASSKKATEPQANNCEIFYLLSGGRVLTNCPPVSH